MRNASSAFVRFESRPFCIYPKSIGVGIGQIGSNPAPGGASIATAEFGLFCSRTSVGAYYRCCDHGNAGYLQGFETVPVLDHGLALATVTNLGNVRFARIDKNTTS
jgi:hypothetical protein